MFAQSVQHLRKKSLSPIFFSFFFFFFFFFFKYKRRCWTIYTVLFYTLYMYRIDSTRDALIYKS